MYGRRRYSAPRGGYARRGYGRRSYGRRSYGARSGMGCAVVTDAQGPVQVKLVDLDRQLDVSITPADDSKE